jgi:hypothetical protein
VANPAVMPRASESAIVFEREAFIYSICNKKNIYQAQISEFGAKN